MSKSEGWSPEPRRLWGLGITTGIVLGLGISLGLYSLSRPELLTPGPLSGGHRTIEDCGACHASVSDEKDSAPTVLPGFHAGTVTDKTCAGCHISTPHHAASRKKNSTNRLKRKKAAYKKKLLKANMSSCLSCHRIHVGSKPEQPMGNQYCSGCHGFEKFKAAHKKKVSRKKRRKARKKKPEHVESTWDFLPGADFFETLESLRKIQKQASTGRHPRFRNRRRRRALKFNHNLHLQKLDRKFYEDAFPKLADSVYEKGRVSCNFCHKFDKAKKNAVGVNFERNCKACHQEKDLQELDHSILLRNLNQSKHAAMKNCSACHKVKKKNIVPLKTAARPWGKFSHRPHTIRMDCSTCHKKIKDAIGLGRSFKTPPSKTCVDCHNGRKAFDTCVGCHGFHPGEHEVKLPRVGELN